MTINDIIVHSLTVSHMVMNRYTADLTPAEYLHRPAPKANCAAWVIGHLTLSERNALRALGAPLPELPAGYEHRFSLAEGCPTADEFGDVTVLMPLFNEHRTRLMYAVKRATPEQLATPLEKPRPPVFTTAGDLANFMAVHSAMHAGQLTMIRRSLGRPPIM